MNAKLFNFIFTMFFFGTIGLLGAAIFSEPFKELFLYYVVPIEVATIIMILAVAGLLAAKRTHAATLYLKKMIQLIESGDLRGAYAMMSPTYRSTHQYANFFNDLMQMKPNTAFNKLSSPTRYSLQRSLLYLNFQYSFSKEELMRVEKVKINNQMYLLQFCLKRKEGQWAVESLDRVSEEELYVARPRPIN